MLFCILNTKLFPCPRTHRIHVNKLSQGFVQNGYHVVEINNINDIFNLSDNDILYVSNHFSVEFFHKYIQKNSFNFLIKKLLKTKANLLLWHFHTVNDWNVLDKLNKEKTIFMSESFNNVAYDNEEFLKLFDNRFNVHQLKYSAPFDPRSELPINFNRSLQFNFVGNGYKKKITAYVDINYHSVIINTPPIINEVKRIDSFRNASINLVFHSDANIKKGVVVERFAEAMSLGGIIFHDHPRICEDYPDVESLFYTPDIEAVILETNKVLKYSSQHVDTLRRTSLKAWKKSGLSYYEQAIEIIKKYQHFNE